MPRALVTVAAVLLLALLAVAAVLFLRQRDVTDLIPRLHLPARETVHDPAALAAEAEAQRAPAAATTATPAAPTRTRADRRPAQLRIHGRVERDPRLPIAGAVLRVIDREVTGGASSSAWPFSGASGVAQVRADAPEHARAELPADGTFDITLDSVGQASELTVQLDHDHYMLPSLPVIDIGDVHGEHDLGTLKTILGALVTGRLVSFAQPSDAEIQVVAEIDMMAPARDPALFAAQIGTSQRQATRASADGVFRLRALAPCPQAYVRVACAEQAGRSIAFPLRAGETREVNVHAQRAATVVVTVRDDAGAALPEANVTLTTTAGALAGRAAVRSGKTDARGEVSLSGLTPGDVRVQVACAGFAAVKETKTLDAGTQSWTYALGFGAALKGRVATDAGAPIEGARIAFQPAASVPMFGDPTAMLAPETLASLADHARCKSDADGTFTLTGLPASGNVNVIVAHDEYAPKLESGVRVGRTDVNLVLLRRAEVTARVLDGERRTALAAFRVELVAPMAMGMEMSIHNQLVHDAADGRFAVQASPTRVTLRITAAGYGVLEQKLTPDPGARVDLGDLLLPPAASIAGRVVDEQGAPVAGARVRVRRGGVMDSEVFQVMRGGGAASSTSDADGAFVLRDVTPGKLRLLAVHPAFAEAESTRLEVLPGQTHRDVVLTLDHGGTIAGKLLLAPGTRAADWDVYAGSTRGGNVKNASVGGDGAFRIECLAPGTYNVQGMHSTGFSTAMQEAGVGDSDVPDIAKLMKRISQHMVQAQCVVKRGEVTHVELDASALEATGATLLCTVLVGDEPLRDGFLEVRAAGEGGRIVPIDKGRAEISGLRVGDVTLQARTGMGFAAIGDAQTTAIARADEEKEFTLRLAGGVLAGRVVDAQDGQPMRGATVRARRVDAVANASTEFGFALTDAQGEFRFRGLAAGTYTVVADEFLSSDPERASGRIEGLTLAASQRREDLVLRARRGAQITVQVRDGAGAPVVQAMVVLVDADGQPAATLPIAVTDRDGRADFAGLPDGPVRAVARVPHLAPGVSDLSRATSGSELTLDVVLLPGPLVTLRIEDARGQPLAGCRVAVKLGNAADAPWLSSHLLGITGTSAPEFDLGAMPSGTLRLRVEPPSGGGFEVERHVPPGRRAALVVSR
jgi:protocatechuate 3,4-dioxygenase beta subunit